MPIRTTDNFEGATLGTEWPLVTEPWWKHPFSWIASFFVKCEPIKWEVDKVNKGDHYAQCTPFGNIAEFGRPLLMPNEMPIPSNILDSLKSGDTVRVEVTSGAQRWFVNGVEIEPQPSDSSPQSPR